MATSFQSLSVWLSTGTGKAIERAFFVIVSALVAQWLLKAPAGATASVGSVYWIVKTAWDVVKPSV